ncbi:hypothetical protein GCM10028805_61100 [Spirosoma harenae]
MNLKNQSVELYRTIRRYCHDYELSKNHQIKLFNYQIHAVNNYNTGYQNDVTSHWLYRFISKRLCLPISKTIGLFSVNGNKLAIKLNSSSYKIFYTVENVHIENSPWYPYRDLLIENNDISLSLGFDYIDHPNYLRFPYWIMALFNPEDSYGDIVEKCHIINTINDNDLTRSKFCAFICRNDYYGHRKYFADEILKIDKVNFPSSFMSNDTDLRDLFGENKREYLKTFKFNLCPENSNTAGYVTEKIFDSLFSGCIPIYWGSENNPEPDILNKSCIFFLKLNSDNEPVINEITKINTNKNIYNSFVKQKKLLPDSPEIIYNYFIKLEEKLKDIIA